MVVKCRDVWGASSDYIDGELSADVSLAIDQHLGNCPPCRAIIAGVRNVVEVLGSQELYEVPAGYFERIHRRLASAIEGRVTGKAVWRATAVASGLLAAGALLVVGIGSKAGSLRAPMSAPAVRVPEKLVAVSDDGKTFHASSCPLLHGRWHLIEAKEAIRRGYNPCPRCMSEALQRGSGKVTQISDRVEIPQ